MSSYVIKRMAPSDFEHMKFAAVTKKQSNEPIGRCNKTPHSEICHNVARNGHFENYSE